MQINTVAAEIAAHLAAEPNGSGAVQKLARALGRSIGDTAAACALLEQWGIVQRPQAESYALVETARLEPLPVVLVVENTAAVAHVVGALLESEGYRVLIAATLPIGVAVTRAVPVTLVIADSFASTARQAFERLRELQDAAGSTPVLMFTAHRDITDEVARAHGYAGLLAKPFDIDDLLARVADVLQRQPAG